MNAYHARFTVKNSGLKNVKFIYMCSEKNTNLLHPASLLEFEDVIMPLINKEKVIFVTAGIENNTNWSMGGDLNYEKELIKNIDINDLIYYTEIFFRIKKLMHDCSTIFIAEVSGHCHGGGLEFACLFDLVFFDSNAQFSLPELNFGFLAGWGGNSELIKRLGKEKALYHIFSRKDISGEKLGFLRIPDYDYRSILWKIHDIDFKTISLLKQILYDKKSDAQCFIEGIQQNKEQIIPAIDDFLHRKSYK